jgi:hypothetical protein
VSGSCSTDACRSNPQSLLVLGEARRGDAGFRPWGVLSFFSAKTSLSYLHLGLVLELLLTGDEQWGALGDLENQRKGTAGLRKFELGCAVRSVPGKMWPPPGRAPPAPNPAAHARI